MTRSQPAVRRDAFLHDLEGGDALYCYACGEQERVVERDSYDPSTGAPEKASLCVNPACLRGCENTTGHKAESFWKHYFAMRTVWGDGYLCTICGHRVCVDMAL